MNVVEIARICHEVNKAYCESLGDVSQPEWEDAPQWQKDSAMTGVKLHLMEDVGPEASHECWMHEKEEQGWKYGPVKDEKNKFHPCMVGFKDLPAHQKAKDFIFRQVVHSMRPFAEYEDVDGDGRLDVDEDVDGDGPRRRKK